MDFLPEDRSNKVKVIIRIRPLTKEESSAGYRVITNADVDCGVVRVFNPENMQQEPKLFKFDMTFDMFSTQMEIFKSTALSLVHNALKGFNGTIMVYGQTGTGKTWTMEGDPNNMDQEGRGIIPNVFIHLFDIISEAQKNITYRININYIEIYNEELHDLLTEDKNKRKLVLKDNFEGGTCIEDLDGYFVSSLEDMNRLFDIGKRNRITGATRMNWCSSRSHAVFTIYITSEQLISCGEMRSVSSKLNLVDLAGYERQAKSQNEGVRFKESTKINKSLTTLGVVLSALSDGKRKHVRYRDSKLTRLLQDSLGGNSETTLIATIGPADYNYKETLYTLRYASRAKNVTYNLTLNEQIKEPQLQSFQDEIRDLRQQLIVVLGDRTEENDLKRYVSTEYLGSDDINLKADQKWDKCKKDEDEYSDEMESEIVNRYNDAHRCLLEMSQKALAAQSKCELRMSHELVKREMELLDSRKRIQDIKDKLVNDMDEVLANIDAIIEKNKLQQQQQVDKINAMVDSRKLGSRQLGAPGSRMAIQDGDTTKARSLATSRERLFEECVSELRLQLGDLNKSEEDVNNHGGDRDDKSEKRLQKSSPLTGLSHFEEQNNKIYRCNQDAPSCIQSTETLHKPTLILSSRSLSEEYSHGGGIHDRDAPTCVNSETTLDNSAHGLNSCCWSERHDHCNGRYDPGSLTSIKSEGTLHNPASFVNTQGWSEGQNYSGGCYDPDSLTCVKSEGTLHKPIPFSNSLSQSEEQKFRDGSYDSHKLICIKPEEMLQNSPLENQGCSAYNCDQNAFSEMGQETMRLNDLEGEGCSRREKIKRESSNSGLHRFGTDRRNSSRDGKKESRTFFEDHRPSEDECSTTHDLACSSLEKRIASRHRREDGYNHYFVQPNAGMGGQGYSMKTYHEQVKEFSSDIDGCPVVRYRHTKVVTCESDGEAGDDEEEDDWDGVVTSDERSEH